MGAGFISAFHLEILARTPDVELVAVCDENLAAAEAAARRCGVPAAVAEIDQLARLGVHVAHLAVPPALHFDLTRRLLELGVGVFAEKPMALSSADALELLRLASSRRLPLAVNHNNVFHPAFQRLVRRVRAGEIGRVEHVQVTFSVPLRQLDAGDYSHWMFRAPRNIVFEQATHPLSQLNHLLGRVRSAQTTLLSQRELHPGQTFIDRWLTAAEAERGTAQLYMAFGQPFTRSTLQVLGSDGCLEADLSHDTLCGEEKTLYLDFWNSFLAGARRARALRQDARRALFGWMGATLGLRARSDQFYAGMRASIQAFHRALRAGEPLPSDARSGVEVSEWCEAVAAGVSGAEAPRPRFPAPGGARGGEVVVLGATGFIGRRVVRKLLERGVPVTAVVRRLHSLPPEISEPALAGKLRVVQGGLLDAAALARALRGATACIHLATGGGNTWDEVERAMVRGSLGVAAACRDAGVRRLVYVSSIASLYTGLDCGTREIADSTETDPLPNWRPVYARGKAAAERALLEFQSEHDVGLIIARPGVVLGAGTPMQHSGLGLWVRDNHCVGWGAGEHPLPLVLVDDVAEALVRAGLHRGAELHGKALNLCARPPLSAREVVAELARATGRRIVFHPRSLALSQAMEIGKWLVKVAGRRPGAAFPSYHDLKARSLAPRFCCELAREILGWRPVEEREEFLERAVRVYGRAHGGGTGDDRRAP
ncbi:MAG: NAD-dependent epimerase/dehydratase family protein [Planctomycetes bacterium]|nr:NAD-dependent epimerase/dehydratase family protein [Planctomycetota bacterium]